MFVLDLPKLQEWRTRQADRIGSSDELAEESVSGP